MERRFTRKIEDFTCEHCGQGVKGNGYTNHCPKCLWSKHVDINPGDRNETCLGMMKPVATEKQGERFFIVHECQRCAFKRRNRVGEFDDFDAFLAVTSLENK